MASFNQLILLGNLTRDPELRYLPNNTPVVGFGMACNRKWRDAQGQDREEVLFIDCAAFGKGGEVINQHCRKGDLLFIEGRLRLETWEDKQGGGKRSKHTVAVNNFQLMPRREGNQEPEPEAPAARRSYMGQTPKPAEPNPQSPVSETPQFTDDSIPF